MKQFFGTAGTSVSAATVITDQYGRPVGSRQAKVKSALTQPTSSPHCKLNSFTSDEWRVDVQLDDKNALKNCEYCSNQYNKNANFCPECRQQNPTRTGRNSYYNQSIAYRDSSSDEDDDECVNCGSILYEENFGSCPNCDTGSQSSADVPTSIQRAIPRYIGEVSRFRHSQDDADEELVDRNYQSQKYWGRAPSAPVRAGNQQSSGKSTTSQISTQINAIQSLLSSWQGL